MARHPHGQGRRWYSASCEYDVTKLLNGNPVFRFRQRRDASLSPSRRLRRRQPGSEHQQQAARALRAGRLERSTSRLTVNAGLRWDYESDMLNNDYVTPDTVRDRDRALRRRQPLLHRRRRPAAVLRRLAAAGRALLRPDRGRQARALRRLRPLLRSRDLQRGPRREIPAAVGRAHFPLLARRRARATDNRRSSGIPSYLSQAGLDGLIASGVAPNPEVFLHRQRDRTAGHGSVQRSASGPAFAGSSSRPPTTPASAASNGFTFLFGNRIPTAPAVRRSPASATS